VGDGARIGRGAKVLSGVTIGGGAAVAPFAVVTRDVPPRTVVAGHPAEEIGPRQDGPMLHRRKRAARQPRPPLTIGTGTYFPPAVHGTGGHVTIGNYSSIAEECEMVLDSHFLPEDERRDIVIGSDVWLGRGVKVLGGVSIGDGAVVAAYSVVIDDVPPYAVFAGNPARQVSQRFDDGVVTALLRIKWWEWSPEQVSDRAPQLCNEDIAAFVAQYET
jgi:acetyltransferase-like isoleucine patch superfamily enzyme